MVKKATRVAVKDKSTLLLAVDHVEVACHGPANYAPYCNFMPGWLVGYDGIIAAGYKVVEDYRIGAHTETLRHALMRAGNPFSVTLSDKMTVRGNGVRVEVPTVVGASIPYAAPDAQTGTVDAMFASALQATAKIISSRNDRVISSSVLIKHNSCVASNGNTIVEGYHGIPVPGMHLVPREFVDALGKVKTSPTGYGFSNQTFTVWFGRDAWLRCNTYQETYPDTDVIFAKMIAECSEYRNMAPDMLLAVETLKPFLETPELMIAPTGVNTRADLTGASYTFEHYLPGDACRVVPYEPLRIAAIHADAIAFNSHGFYWYGKQLRGITRA